MEFSKFFSNIQETPWYRSFLDPVINEIDKKGTLLDIGTGSGKLIQILSVEKEIDCIGVDTNESMLKEARHKLRESKVEVLKIEANQKLPFKDNSFNYITICSVFFHLENEQIDFMLKDAQRLLRKGGKIIILTPTGKGSVLTLSKRYFSLKNLSIYTWYRATKKRAKLWSQNKHLKQYSNNYKLDYKSHLVMNDFALLEIIKE